jgi:nucleotide-binding universal stress UspA family protein
MSNDLRDAILDEVPPGSIVVGFDGSEHAARALDWAAAQAALEHRRLAVVHGFHPVARTLLGALTMEGGDRPELLHALRAAERCSLHDAAERVRSAYPDLDVETHLIEADARQVLITAAEHAHLLVVGSRGRGPVASLLLGSVSTAAAQLAPCPVVVCRPRPVTTPRHSGVVVGADGSPESMPVIEFAFRHASLHGVPLTVMHCFWEVVTADALAQRAGGPTDMELVLAESVAGFAAVYPDVPVELKPARGLVDLVLAQTAPEADLLVVGRRHLSAISRQLHSSMAAAVLERAAGTVAVVPESPSGD